MSNTPVSNAIHTIVTRVEAVVNEVLAFVANLAHVIRGDLVKHVVTPAEDVALKVEAAAKAVASDVATKV